MQTLAYVIFKVENENSVPSSSQFPKWNRNVILQNVSPGVRLTDDKRDISYTPFLNKDLRVILKEVTIGTRKPWQSQ